MTCLRIPLAPKMEFLKYFRIDRYFFTNALVFEKNTAYYKRLDELTSIISVKFRVKTLLKNCLL